MSLFMRAKDVTSDLAAASKRQAMKAKLEVEVRRLEMKVSSEKDAIGHAVFPILESGSISIDVPEVREHMKNISELTAQIARKRLEMDELSHGRGEGETFLSEERAEETWANEGGGNPGTPDAMRRPGEIEPSGETPMGDQIGGSSEVTGETPPEM